MKAGFQEVSGLGMEVTVAEYRSGNDKANHIKQISDYGAELGGPIVKDKLWFAFNVELLTRNLGREIEQDLPPPQVQKRRWFKGTAKLTWQITPRILAEAMDGEPGRAVSFTFEPRREGNARKDVEVRLVVASERDDLDETLWHLLGLSGGSGVVLLGVARVVGLFLGFALGYVLPTPGP